MKIKKAIKELIRLYGVTILLVGGLVGYVYYMGTTEKCAMCSAITSVVGLGGEADSAQTTEDQPTGQK